MTEKEYYNLLDSCYDRHDINRERWQDIVDDINSKYGFNLTASALKNRACRYRRKRRKIEDAATDNNNNNNNFQNNIKQQINTNVYSQCNADGSFEGATNIEDVEITKDPETLLNTLGFDPSKWNLLTYRVSQWQQPGSNGKVLWGLKYKVSPKVEFTYRDAINCAKDAFKEAILPYDVEKWKVELEDEIEEYDDNKLMEIPPVELHLGKRADTIESGEDYDLDIASNRFFDIITSIVEKQKIEKCGKCLLVIGGDFFNAESDYATSIHKIPQQEAASSLKTFTKGLRMYISAIFTLKKYFKKIDVMLCAGNHARSKETYLYLTLEQRFYNDNAVKFVDNYRKTQAYEFGDCVIFYNHGDVKMNQLLKSIPAGFPNIWGKHKYRELHLGHLHKEYTVNDDGGMITRRIGAPCSTDAWHEENRFVGAVKKHEIFIWDKYNGLEQLYYINIKQ